MKPALRLVESDAPALVAPEIEEAMVEVRRDLHRHPELSGQEARTASKVQRFLESHGIAYTAEVGGHGVVADIPSQNQGPKVALRADLDALPIDEETGLPFASERPGLMHACGHDGHTAMLLGAAAMLARHTPLPAPVRLIFQPAEETAKGAKAMIDEGVLDGVGKIFGGHLDRHYDVGEIAISDAAVNASSDRFRITIAGAGGHAARPHEAVDAVVAGSLMVTAIQTIVSREVNPAHPSVVTVGRFSAGTAPNVIASHAELEGSIRAQEPDVREALHDAITRMARAIGQLHGAEVDVEIEMGTPAVYNRPAVAGLAREAAAAVVGVEGVVPMAVANMGGEDFGFYLEHVPGCYVRFGSARAGSENFPAHSSRFDFDERALAVGAAYYRQVALAAGEQLASS